MVYATISSFEFDLLKTILQSELKKLPDLRGTVLQSSQSLSLGYHLCPDFEAISINF